MPFLMVVRAVSGIALDHVGDVAVVLAAFHLAVAHGADVDAGSTLQARHLGQHEGGVAAHGRRRGDGAVAGTVIVQVLVRVLPARSGDHAGAADIAVDQESHLVGVRAEGFQNVIGAGEHFIMIVGGDVGGKQFGLAGFVHGALHRVIDQRDNLLGRAEHLVALWFVVLDEVAAQPELVGRLGKGLGTQAEFRLDDGAGNVAAVGAGTAQNVPQVGDVLGRTVVHAQHRPGHVEILHLQMFHIAHALIVADRQRQEGHQHGAAVGQVAVEQVIRVSDFHHAVGFVDEVHQRVHALGEVIGGGDFDVGAGGRFGGNVCRDFQVTVTRGGLHVIGDQHMLVTLDQVLFLEAQVGVAVRLIHRVSPRALFVQAFVQANGAAGSAD